MTQAKIALMGKTPFFERMLPGILRDSGYEVHRFYDKTIDDGKISRLDGYDLLILSGDFVEELEAKALFSCLLSTKGFLIAEVDPQAGPIPQGAGYISHTMSPEEIIFRVNNIIYKSNNMRKSSRVRVSIPVEYEYRGRYFKSEITTISQFGAFINSLSPPPNNSRLRMLFSLTPEGERIFATARVLYSIGYDLGKGIISHPERSDRKIIALPGMGVFFEKISETDQEAVGSFIEQAVS